MRATGIEKIQLDHLKAPLVKDSAEDLPEPGLEAGGIKVQGVEPAVPTGIDAGFDRAAFFIFQDPVVMLPPQPGFCVADKGGQPEPWPETLVPGSPGESVQAGGKFGIYIQPVPDAPLPAVVNLKDVKGVTRSGQCSEIAADNFFIDFGVVIVPAGPAGAAARGPPMPGQEAGKFLPYLLLTALAYVDFQKGILRGGFPQAIPANAEAALN